MCCRDDVRCTKGDEKARTTSVAHGTIFLEKLFDKFAADNEVFQLLKGLQGVFRSVGFTSGPRETKFDQAARMAFLTLDLK
ncbi:11503_t:CDS:2 [Funneliformis caledonium]|uniref:11503_t:CDS:1 n=1 Tax=Funneliformis caledonium TaxID=1117310 RepID=A0A9N9HRQ2_9GLOM|nr:11503_t:CDS:2 [Funneliformis caledonium]